MILETSVAMNIIMFAMLIVWTLRIETLKGIRREQLAKITELEHQNTELRLYHCPAKYSMCPLEIGLIHKEDSK